MATAVPCVWIVRYNRMFQIERDGVMRHYGQQPFYPF